MTIFGNRNGHPSPNGQAQAREDERFAALEEALARERAARLALEERLDQALGQQGGVGASLPEEVSTDEAAEVLGVSKDTVLAYYRAGLLPARNIAPPRSSRPVYRFLKEAVLKLRTTYEVPESPSPPRPEEGPRRPVKGQKKYKHLKTDGGDGH